MRRPSRAEEVADFVVQAGGTVRSKQVAEKFGVTRFRAAALLAEAEEKGLVKRGANRGDWVAVTQDISAA